MALTVTFSPKNLSAAQYDACIKALEAVGAGMPSGRVFTTCFGQPNALKVMDVWASQAQFEAFGQTLMPILAQLGIDPGTPDIQPQHNCIIGR